MTLKKLYVTESIACNNTGIFHLANGSYEEAYEVLKYSLECLNIISSASSATSSTTNEYNHVLVEEPSTSNNNNEDIISYDWIDLREEGKRWHNNKDRRHHNNQGSTLNNNAAAAGSSSSSNFQHHRDSMKNDIISDNLSPLANGTCRSAPFFCHLAIKININNNNDEEDGCFDFDDVDARLRWAIEYNLAVLTHYLSYCLGESRGGLFWLQQAHQHYMTGLTSLHSSIPFKDCFRLLLSAQNNLSCIFLDYGMYNENTSSMQLLTKLMIDLKTSTRTRRGSYSSSSSSSSEEDYNNDDDDSGDSSVLLSSSSSSSPANILGMYSLGNDHMNSKIFLNLLVLSKFHVLAAAA